MDFFNDIQSKKMVKAFREQGVTLVLKLASISADEWMLGKLDEDMTDEEYAEYGTASAKETRKQNKINELNLTIEQRRHLLQIAHLIFLEQKGDSVTFESFITA